MSKLYEDSEGVVRVMESNNMFRITVHDEGATVVFTVGNSDIPIETFDTVEEADAAYDSIVKHAVDVNDAITMIRERAE